MQPTITPTVATDAASNCRITSDANIHAQPVSNHSHQRRWNARVSATASVAPSTSEVTATARP